MGETQDGSRIDQVMATVRTRIERRVLTPGTRLASVRAMAEATGFSKTTVVEAYDRLVAEGTIRARPGSGFYVAAPLAPLSLARTEQRDPEDDPLWMMHQALVPQPGTLRPGYGWLPDAWMPEELLRKGLRAIARDAPARTMLRYGTPMGSETLRRLISRRMIEQGIEAGPDQVLLTDSGTQAIDLVCRFLIEPGDAVLVDDPGYFNFQAMLRAHRARPIGVAQTPAGPDLAAFAEAIATHRPRLYITNSASQNPTGATLSAATAHRVLKLAEQHDLIVLEDDIFADFEAEPGVRYAAFDGLDRVIRIGSFSKSLSSAVRCGHVAARPDWIPALTDLRIATGMSGSPLASELLHTVLTDGSYRRHMDRVRDRLDQARARTIRRLRAVGIVPWIEPAAGLFVWGRLPDGVEAIDVTRRGLAENIVFAPGNAFSPTRTAGAFLRFNVTLTDDDRIFRFLERTI